MPSALAIVRQFFPRVTKVTDAPRSLIIDVTLGDTKSAAIKNHRACAAAVACKRQYHLDGVIVSRSMAYLIRGRKATRYMVPSELVREVVAFDRGGKFEPGQYHLTRPAANIRLGRKRPHRSDKRGLIGKHRKHRHVTTNIRAVLAGASR